MTVQFGQQLAIGAVEVARALASDLFGDAQAAVVVAVAGQGLGLSALLLFDGGKAPQGVPVVVALAHAGGLAVGAVAGRGVGIDLP